MSTKFTVTVSGAADAKTIRYNANILTSADDREKLKKLNMHVLRNDADFPPVLIIVSEEAEFEMLVTDKGNAVIFLPELISRTSKARNWSVISGAPAGKINDFAVAFQAACEDIESFLLNGTLINNHLEPLTIEQ